VRYQVAVGDRRIGIDATPEGRMLVDGRVLAYDAREVGSATWSILVEGSSHEVVLLGEGRARIDGIEIPLAVADERAVAARSERALASGGRHEVRAPMPGLLKAVHVAVGDVVERDAPIATLEAMKMENELRAPSRSKVQRVAAAAGAKVESGSLIAILVEEPA